MPKKISPDTGLGMKSTGYGQTKRGGGGGGGKPASGSITLMASPASSTQVSLSWTVVNTTSPYKIYRNGFFIASTTNFNYVDSGRTPNTSYSYQVISSDRQAISSNVVSVVTPPMAVGGTPTILLTFGGITMSGTSFNFNNQTFAASGLSDNEISYVTDQVKAGFYFGNFIITTDETVYQTANQYNRMRVIITESYEWYGNTASGVAYDNSWTFGDNTPCFVFSSLLYYDLGYITRVIMHELGHTWNLHHTTQNLITNGMSDWMSNVFGVPGYYGQPATDLNGNLVYEQTVILQVTGQA